MATVDPVEPAVDAARPDARQVRVLKIVVIALGIMLLAGFAVVIARIAYLATQPGRGISSVGPQDVSVALPPGAVIRNTAISGDRMTVQFETAQQMGLVIINLTTGQVVSRIGFHPEAPRD